MQAKLAARRPATPAGRARRRWSSRTRSTTCRSSRSRCTARATTRACCARSRAHLDDEIRTVPDVAETVRLIGGAAAAVSRHARSGAPRRERGHAGRGGGWRSRARTRRLPAGEFSAARPGLPGRRRRVRSRRADDVGSVVVGDRGGAPVLPAQRRATSPTAPAETTTYVSHDERGGERRSRR